MAFGAGFWIVGTAGQASHFAQNSLTACGRMFMIVTRP
jgi:hypothetical protein